MKTYALNIKDLHAVLKEKQTAILKGVSLTVDTGQVCAIMGPNGSGKSTLANVLMGNPLWEVTGGKVDFFGEDLLAKEVFQRALEGLFMGFQYPQEIPGLTVGKFLKRLAEIECTRLGKKFKIKVFLQTVKSYMQVLNIPQEFINRALNDGFSGGEKKRMEILQMLILKPKLAILDEIDSGLDIDALKSVATALKLMKQENPEFTTLIITHYQRILEHISLDRVYIMSGGRVITFGGKKLIEELEQFGYSHLQKRLGLKDEEELV